MTNEELESRISQLEDRMASQEEESRMILMTIGELDKMIGAVETLAGNARQNSFIVAGASGNRMNRIEERVAKTEDALYKEDPNVSEIRGISEPTLTLRRRVHLLEDALITITRSRVVPGSAGWALSDAVDEYLPFRDGLPLDGRESKEALK